MQFIRQATSSDRLVVEKLVSKHQDSLQQQRLPAIQNYILFELFGIVLGCCALKGRSQKLWEIWSLAYPRWWGWPIAWLLLRACSQRARQQGVYQLLLLGRSRWFLSVAGFRNFKGHKHALLRPMAGAKPVKLSEIPGVVFRPAEPKDRAAIIGLIVANPSKLFQTLLPSLKDFFVAEVDGEVVGCCALDVYDQDLAEVRSLVVDHSRTKRSLGRSLIACCFNRAIKLRVVELLTITDEQVAVLFKRFGFDPLRGSEQPLLKILRNGATDPVVTIGVCGYGAAHPFIQRIMDSGRAELDWCIGNGLGIVRCVFLPEKPDVLVIRPGWRYSGEIRRLVAVPTVESWDPLTDLVTVSRNINPKVRLGYGRSQLDRRSLK